MVRSGTSTRRRGAHWPGVLTIVGLALLAYVPFFVSAPGQVSADTKQYLYLDPGRFLWRALHLWDPHVGAGTVSHQHIGYLFPMGPWFWAFEQLGTPDWVAQRLWWGTISLAAALGARWLFTLLGVQRLGALAGALVYMLTPYQLAFTARISVLLLPWAALPWLVGLAMRSVRRGGWRDPALFALVTLTAGGVNASSLLLVGLGPLLWLLVEASRGRQAARVALRAAARIGVLTLGVSIWWLVGLGLQGAYGLPVLKLTESVRTVATHSSPADLLRGLGNWFFYSREGVGYSIDQAAAYLEDSTVVFFSFAVPVLALFAAAALRWRHRTYFALLVVVGTVVGAGAWPYEEPSPYGALWTSFADTSSIGLALRNTPRVAPVVVLGVAGLLAAAVGAIARRPLRLAGAIIVAALAFGAFAPVWQTGYLSDGLRRPEEIPEYWREATAALDAAGSATRVLEVPGVNFAAYRWGNAIEPVTPGLMDRPYLAREVLPYGSPGSVNLLDAFDRRLQQGTFEPDSLAPVARLFAAGTVSLRSDLQFERFGTPRPRLLWDLLTDPLPQGLEEPRSFGPAVRNAPPPHLATVDELELQSRPSAPDPPPVALFDVEGAPPIVHTASPWNPVVLAGDADGIVESAGAGLVDGRALLFELGALGGAELDGALVSGADLVLTDSNRRRAQRWFSSLRETMGATEQAGRTAPDPNGDDFRLDPFPNPTDDTRTVVEQEGGHVAATSASVPQDRPARAFDGDLRTAWRVGGADPTGERLSIELQEPVVASSVRLVQPQDGPKARVLTEVHLRLDGGEPMEVQLGPGSLDPEGQVITFPERSLTRLEIELAATSQPSSDPASADLVGFAEVSLADVRVTETVRLPVDLAGRIGTDAVGHGLDVVLARLRSDPAERGAPDQELALRRRFELPDDRSFRLTGTARINAVAPEVVLDEVLGTVGPGAAFTSSGHLSGDPASRASRAGDGDASTWWSAPRGPQQGAWLQVDVPAPVQVDGVDVTVVADGRHSVPTSIRVEADGEPIGTVAVPAVADGAEEGATVRVSLPFPAVQARQLRLVVDGVRRSSLEGEDPAPEPTLPVALAEVELGGVPRHAGPAEVPPTCRDDLLRIDGRVVAVRLIGSHDEARSGLAVEACGGDIDLRAGSHRLDARPGLDTGIDLDRLVLSSGADGSAAPVRPRGGGQQEVGSTATVVDGGPTSFDLSLQTDGEPFWLILGQSSSEGWQANLSDGSLGSRQLVNGYANGWLITPSRPGLMTMELRWTPQRLVWVGLALSAAAVLGCAAILVSASSRRRLVPAPSADLSQPAQLAAPFASCAGPAPWIPTGTFALLTLLVVTAVSRPWIGAIAAVAVVAAARVGIFRGAVALAVPVLLALSHLLDAPHLAWLALALLVADLLVLQLRRRRHPRRASRSPRLLRSGRLMLGPLSDRPGSGAISLRRRLVPSRSVPVAAPALDRIVGTEAAPRSEDADELLPPAPLWLHVVDVAVLACVAAAAVVSRFRTRSPLWLDEALSVNIAGLPLGEIPGALRSDGHPPLYYVLLHGWMEIFGDSPFAVRALSGVFALALFPLLWVAARRLGGRRVAVASVILLAVSPYVIRYATETRMYSMMMVLAVAGYLLGESALRRPQPLTVLGLALVSGALLWTHYWGMWVLAAAGLGMTMRWWLQRQRGEGVAARRSLTVLGALVAGGLSFVPWLPSLAYQAEHTGTPWGEPTGPIAVVRTTVLDLGGSGRYLGMIGGGLLVLLVLLGLAGMARHRHRIAPWFPSPALRRLALLLGLAVVIAQVVSYATGATYQSRYLAPLVPFIFLLAGRGLAQVTHPAAFRALVVVLVVVGLVAVERNVVTIPRTQARAAAEVIRAGGSPDDVVVVCPDQLGPSLTRELEGYEVVSDPVLAPAARVDWVDYKARLDGHPSREVAAEVMRRAEGRQLWVVWSAAYELTHRGRCRTLVELLEQERPWGREVLREDPTRYEHEAVHRFRASR